MTYGVFNGPRYNILGQVEPGIHNNPGTVDVDLDVSQTAGKRIVFRWRVQGECYCCGIDDICVVTVPCSGPFITLTPDAATVFTGSTETLTATYGNVSGTPTINYTSSDTNVATVSGSGTTATVTAVAPGTATITVSMMTYQETTYTATSTITVEDRSYCTPSFSNTTDYIANFTLGEINNSTGFSTNGYGDYTNLSASLEPGKTATASLTSSSGSGDHAAAVWIDFNDNHVFEDSERVGTQDNIGANATVSISFAIPSDAKVGYHRLRVVYQLNAPESINPCVSSYYGEGEDYTVAIVCSKQIEPYSSEEGMNNGWYLIATPMTGYDNPTVGTIVGMITADEGEGQNIVHTYDLYRFDQAQDLEWRNFRAAPFVLVNGQGYLYASKNGTTLTFAGTPYNGNGQVDLVYDSNAQNFAGWNLVGNPFNQTAYIDMPFYTLDGDSEYVEKAAGEAINPMQGVLVHTDAAATLTFSTTPISNSKSSRLTLNLTQGRSITDCAILSFNESKPLPKMQLRENSTKVYFPVDGKDYAVVSAEESMGEMPVSFKAEENGTYSLSFNAEDVTFAYFHLIDNMTGNDVDLLANPSYTFEAKTTDYASRFKLVFATGSSTSSDTFAFYSNGNWIINNEGNATLQVIDVNGHILSSESINGCADVNINAASGVYMLRLVNGDSVKVQKVVVR